MTGTHIRAGDAQAVAEMLRALAHPMRLAILCRLQDGEASVGAFEAELGLRQPSLSQQLAQLREAGLVATRRESKTIIYRLDDARVAPILDALQTMFHAKPEAAAAVQPAPPPAAARPQQRRDQAAAPHPGECGVFSKAGWPRG